MVGRALGGRAARGRDLGQRSRWNLEPLVGRRNGLVCRPWVNPPTSGMAQGGVDPTMTESTCLHIQDRESGPIRVVELPWISVRIGRAAHCEVRLTEHDLPDEVCRLQRRGQSWRLLPAKSESPILLEGRRPGGPCLLPFNVPFRVGQYCLTLRQDRAAEPDWEIYSGPAPPRPAETQDRIEAGHSTCDQPPVAEPDPGTPRKLELTRAHKAKPVIADEQPIADAQPEPKQAPS